MGRKLNFGPEKNFGLKTIFGPKLILCQQIFISYKKFGVKENFGLKKSLVEKNLGSKKILKIEEKNLWLVGKFIDEKNFGQINCQSKKILVKKKFLGPKKFMS